MSHRLIELESRFIVVALVGFAGVAFSATGALGWLFGDGNALQLLLPGLALLLGVTLLVVRTKRAIQVEQVRERLTAKLPPTYRTIVQLNSDGSLAAFTCRVPLSVGTHVSVDIRGELAPMGPHSLVLGVVVSQEVQLE